MRRFLFFTTLIVCLFTAGRALSAPPKRAFRGAWIQAVNGQFMGLSRQTVQSTLRQQLDALQQEGVNTIIFQVRVEGDALYHSTYEPWSRFLTGTQGKDPGWDPLEWMVRECHKRGMELHAWINPFRAKVKDYNTLASNHICLRQPNCYFEYDGLYILNPGIPENRAYICSVARDIVSRYDIDGFHIDDYFYPYPVAGKTIPDGEQYAMYNMGFKDIADWRRDNVNVFIQQLAETIHAEKPWVKFGVSPFGIYRNKETDPRNGSNTNGLQNYDDLYADVLLWVNNGWVDYCVPQLYWEIGHKTADYSILLRWWNDNCRYRPLYIGESIENTITHRDMRHDSADQMDAKFHMYAQMPYVQGSVLWYAQLAADDAGGYGSRLRDVYWCYPALQPAMPFLDDTTPSKVRKVSTLWTADGYMLFWTAPKSSSWRDKAEKYVVYRFDNDEEINIDDATKIVAITDKTFCSLPYTNGKTPYIYVVTALNRLQNEGVAVRKKVKL